MANAKIHYKINVQRILFLIDFFKITQKKFLELINQGLKEKNKIKFKDFENKIELWKIKRIDKTFNKGITWYIDPTEPIKSNGSSIFFRKKKFNSKTEIEDVKTIDAFEEKRILAKILCDNVGFKLTRKIKKFNTKQDVDEAVKTVKNEFKEKENKTTKSGQNDKKFLTDLFRKIESLNVFVFEHLEQHNKKNKVNFEGFYLKNTIVIKRQDNLRREIFTLLHELGHYLLDEEEIDQDIDKKQTESKTQKTENWCNEFAFTFLLGDYKERFDKLKSPDTKNKFYEREIDGLVEKTQLNPLSFYTNLLIRKKIDWYKYQEKKKEIETNFKKKIRTEKQLRKQNAELKKSQGKKTYAIPREIKSELFENIVKTNFNLGKIDDVDLCNYLNVKNEKNKPEAPLQW